MSKAGMKAAPGTNTASTGKGAVRTTLTPTFGKRAGKRSASKRGGGRSR